MGRFTKILTRLRELFAPPRMGWANAHRIADEHDAEVSWIHTQAWNNFAKRFFR